MLTNKRELHKIILNNFENIIRMGLNKAVGPGK